MFGMDMDKLRSCLERAASLPKDAPTEEVKQVAIDCMMETRPLLQAVSSGLIPIAAPHQIIFYIVNACIAFCLAYLDELDGKEKKDELDEFNKLMKQMENGDSNGTRDDE